MTRAKLSRYQPSRTRKTGDGPTNGHEEASGEVDLCRRTTRREATWRTRSTGGPPQQTPVPQQTPTADQASRSRAALHDVVIRADAEPGCSAAVGRQGDVLWQGHRGLAVLNSQTAITEGTRFDIGSVSKQFTALAVALLAENGQLSLDDTVADQRPQDLADIALLRKLRAQPD